MDTVMIETRLIHGQVGILWTRYLQAEMLVVANDDVVEDEIRRNIMTMIAPSGCEIKFVRLQDAAQCLTETEKRCLVLAEKPSDVEKMIQYGCVFDAVHVGHLEKKENSVQAATLVHVDEQDKAAFRAIREAGLKCIIQRFPEAVNEDDSGLFE